MIAVSVTKALQKMKHTTITFNPVSVLPLHTNQSIDLLYKSIDWFLYESNTIT